MNPPPLAPFRIDELDFDDQPELALIVTRRAIEERLEWLMSYLAPNERGVNPDPNIDALKSHGGFDAKTVRAIRHVLTATNPVAHGRSVSPSVAAVVADSADRVVTALDEMISRLQGTASRHAAQVHACICLLGTAEHDAASHRAAPRCLRGE